MGDLFTRFMMAIPVRDETAATISRVLLDRWVLFFGPPEKLLSDRGKVFSGEVIRHLCAQVVTKTIFSSAYHPQTDGCVERFNRTLCNDIAKFVLDEVDWDQHVYMATFRYNTSVHQATGISPYRAMFGVDVFEFDAGVGLQLRLDKEPTSLAERLKEVHRDLLEAGKRSRTVAARFYDLSVKETSFEVGDRVLVWHPPGEVEVGRKLRVPWIGPYRVMDQHSPVSYSLKAEVGDKVARAHVNRLRKVEPEAVVETSQPKDGLWLDSRRLLRSILSSRTTADGRVQYQVKHAGRTRFVWEDASALPDVVKEAFRIAREHTLVYGGGDQSNRSRNPAKWLGRKGAGRGKVVAGKC
jgi:hypothetical protein